MLKKRQKEVKQNILFNEVKKKHNRQIAGKKPPLIRISMIGIERIDIEKKRFLYKNIF